MQIRFPSNIRGCGLCCVLIILFAALSLTTQAAFYTNDANTICLDHFDGVTTGVLQGAVSFTNGLIPLDRCAYLPTNAFIMYSSAIAYLSSGTIEIWVKPS